jgi:hypothetical protein
MHIFVSITYMFSSLPVKHESNVMHGKDINEKHIHEININIH